MMILEQGNNFETNLPCVYIYIYIYIYIHRRYCFNVSRMSLEAYVHCYFGLSSVCFMLILKQEQSPHLNSLVAVFSRGSS